MAKFIESNRGKRMLVFDNYKFSFANTKLDRTTRWKCVIRSCSVKLYTNENDEILKNVHDSNINHNHNPYETKIIDRQIINTSCKRKATEDIFVRPKKIIFKEIQQNNCSEFNETDIKCLRKNLYEHRRKTLPVNPNTIQEVHEALDNLDVKTMNGESFLILNDSEKHIIIFSCQTNLTFINEVDTIYMDGTFKYCPRFFLQMFTIHGLKNGHYIPLIFCLLPDKSFETYLFTLRYIVNKCNLLFSPKFVTVDFEISIHKAIVEIWPDSKIIGCRFHLTQSWFRQVQSLGLVGEYKNDLSEIGNFIKYTFGLLFLNPGDVEDCFVDDLMAICPDDDKLKSYCDYLTDTYISEESIFPPTIWASGSSDLTRTTNACESFHSYFNQCFYKDSPPIMYWLNIIHEIQTETYVKMRSVDIQKFPKDGKVRSRQDKNQTYITNYERGEITRIEFIKRMCYNYKKTRI